MSEPPARKKPSSVPALHAFVPREAPLPTTMEDLGREIRQTRRLLEEHLQHDREDRAATAKRQEAIMTMLADIIGRLPA